MGRPAIDVAVAVVRNAAGHVLLAERTARQLGAGFWELPGGKIEPGETPALAAARELREETGLIAGELQPLMAYDHAFPTKRVRLHIFHASTWQGTATGREGQRLAWTDPASPGVAPILPSNHRVLTALGLPPRMAIIDLDVAAPLVPFHAALSSGARLLQVRGDRLAPDQRVSLARRVCQLAHAAGARVLLAASPQEAARAGATGLHSNAASFRAMMARPPVRLWSVSCFDAADVARAEALGADLAMIGGPHEGAAFRLPAPAGLPLYATAWPEHVSGRPHAEAATMTTPAVTSRRGAMTSGGAAANTAPHAH